MDFHPFHQNNMDKHYTKYLGIPFKHHGRDFDGVDCYGLLVLYFKNELGLILPDFLYDIDWSKSGKNIIAEEYSQLARPINNPQKNDIVLFNVNFGCPVINHVGIVVSPPNKVLQAMKTKVMLNDLNSPILKKYFNGYYRLCQL